MEQSIKWLILLILFLIVAAVMILIVYGIPYVENTLLYPERTKLVRYFACSLAICTKGCDGSDPDNTVANICLENYTDTPGCDVECKSVCESFGSQLGYLPGPNVACGNNYSMKLSLQGKGPLGGVPLKGLYRVVYVIGEPLPLGPCKRCDDATNLIYFMKNKKYDCLPPDVIDFPKLSLMKIINFPLSIMGLFAKTSGGSNYPNFPEPEDLLGSGCGMDFFGGIFDSSSYGQGSILLDQGMATDTFGCSKQSPFDGVVSSTLCGGDMGYYQCNFQGDLYLWASKKSNGCADVNINSTPPEPGVFWVTIQPPKQTVKLYEEAVYGVTIENHLGTGSEFTLSGSSTGLAVPAEDLFLSGLCTFDTNSVWIDNNMPETVTLRCTIPDPPPDENVLKGEQLIDVAVSTPGYLTEHGTAKLEVVDMELIVHEKDRPEDDDEATVTKGVNAEYTVYLFSNFNTPENFDLSYISNDPSVTCSFYDNPLPVGPQSPAETTMRCSSNNLGEYTITVTASHAGTGLTRYATVKLIVTGCQGDLIFDKSSYSATSGSTVQIGVSGFSGCGGKDIFLAVVDPDLTTSKCHVGSGGSKCPDSTEGWSPSLVANSPGTYTVYVKMDMDGGSKINSTTLTINAPSMSDGTCDTNGGCDFSLGEETCWNGVLTSSTDICDYCVCHATWPMDGCGWWRADNCGIVGADDSVTYDLDPQSNRCDSPSNICCKSESDEYSNGPGIPCLSPDTNTHGGGYHTKNFTWRGSDLDYARNILVWDGKDGSDTFGTARFHDDQCSQKKNCDGTEGVGSGFTGLSDANCVDWELSGPTMGCKLGDIDEPYFSWIYIRIAPDGESRPVYGVKLRFKTIYHGGCKWEGYNSYKLFLHDKDTGWFYGGFTQKSYLGHARCGGDLYDWNEGNLKPPSGWSWNNIDAIMVGYYGYVRNNQDNSHIDEQSWLDYVGLLTKGADVPYCTEGNETDYHRTVDDGKTCYWNLNCPASGGGWTTDSPASTGVGAFSECNCNPAVNSGAHCDEGYCKLGEKLCYYNVTCKHGGWSGSYDVCADPMQSCTSSGC